MESLFSRHFSSIYVHYIPLEGFQTLGNSGTIISQIERLASKIVEDSKRVQEERAKFWTMFDAKQLAILFDYAFKHLASGTDDPFDFSQCRQQNSFPATTEGLFAEFLGRCLHGGAKKNFEAASAIVASCIVRDSLKRGGSGELILTRATIHIPLLLQTF